MSQPKLIFRNWELKSEKNAHLLFIVAYRMLAFGDDRTAAIHRTARASGVKPGSLSRLARDSIKHNNRR